MKQTNVDYLLIEGLKDFGITEYKAVQLQWDSAKIQKHIISLIFSLIPNQIKMRSKDILVPFKL